MKRCLILLAAGLVATASLLLAPLELLKPAEVPVDGMTFRVIALIQPAILVTLMTALGCWLAPKVGLDAPLTGALAKGGGAGAVLRRQIGPAALAGLIVAGVLLTYGWFSRDWMADAPAAYSFQPPLVSKLLYGGIAEELLTRWGLMTLFVWVAWKIGGSAATVPGWCYWTGVLLAALLFAAGHLPALYALVPSVSMPLLLAVLAANALPGVLFGVLYWKRGLEAAMLAHALAHAIATAAMPLMP